MTAFVLCMAVTQMAVFPKLNQRFGLFPLGIVSYLAAGASYTGYVIINDNSWADMSIWFAFWLALSASSRAVPAGPSSTSPSLTLRLVGLATWVR